ncbi:conserved hypothetical protein [Brochothrix thermosphacta]|nr:hypothetical protein FM106_14115 [Brachybacterium faecium]SPN76237.1 conserved hypothetical protein [Brochothrix thermosphacta]SPP27998.1 conserved hypothetical protein [Brochothrix thermosphacta]
MLFYNLEIFHVKIISKIIVFIDQENHSIFKYYLVVAVFCCYIRKRGD